MMFARAITTAALVSSAMIAAAQSEQTLLAQAALKDILRRGEPILGN
jgi:hypothetical protein